MLLQRCIYYIQPEAKKGDKVVLVHYAQPDTGPRTTKRKGRDGGAATPHSKKPRDGDSTPGV